MTEIPLPLYQDFLSRLRLDGWLLYDFQGRILSPVAWPVSLKTGSLRVAGSTSSPPRRPGWDRSLPSKATT